MLCGLLCWAAPDCKTCGKRKAPRGRSIPLPMAGGLCDTDCPGYNEEPRSGHYWPGEEAVGEPDTKGGG